MQNLSTAVSVHFRCFALPDDTQAQGISSFETFSADVAAAESTFCSSIPNGISLNLQQLLQGRWHLSLAGRCQYPAMSCPGNHLIPMSLQGLCADISPERLRTESMPSASCDIFSGLTCPTHVWFDVQIRCLISSPNWHSSSHRMT